MGGGGGGGGGGLVWGEVELLGGGGKLPPLPLQEVPTTQEGGLDTCPRK